MAELSAYRAMWLFCMFDLPTKTKTERRTYTRFRKKLMSIGFDMMQYSVYVKHCGSVQGADTAERLVREIIPQKGLVDVLRVTDKQFGRLRRYVGRKREKPPEPAHQLTLF